MSIPTLVIDFGSDTIKVGMSTSEEPDLIIPNCFPKDNVKFKVTDPIPPDAELDYAIVNGEVANKERINFIFAHIYQHYFPEEKDEPDELRVIFNETPFACKDNIKFLAETVFDLVGATEISIKPQAVYSLALFSINTSICLDIGHDIMQCVPQSQGYVIPHAIQRSFLAGHALDYFTSRAILEEDDVKTYADLKKVREVKESISVPMNLSEAINQVPEEDDDALLRLTCGEILFKPKLIEEAAENPDEPQSDPLISKFMESPTPAEMIKKSIELCDLPYRGELWNNIIITGGATKMKGFRERLEKELAAIKPANVQFHCRYPEDDPTLVTWKGAALSAKFDSKENWLSDDDFKENPNCIFEKFRTFGTSFAPPK